MFKRFCILFLVALMPALFPSAGQVSAQDLRTQFTGVVATCSATQGTQWVSGNVLHIRGEVDSKRLAATDLRLQGAATVVVNVDLNLVNGNGNGWGTLVIRPDGIGGTWKGSFSGAITAGVFAGRGVAQGSGTLERMMLNTRFQQIPIPPDQPCAPDPALDVDSISGMILPPR